jgi:hypothetical protein
VGRAKKPQRPTVLDRVKSQLDEMRGGGWSDPYTPNSPATEGQVATWQTTRGVLLPEEYRLFVLEVGDGGRMPCRMPGAYCDFVVRSLDQLPARPGLATPFPIGRRRLRERMARLDAEGWEGVTTLFPDLDEFWEAGPLPGCLHLADYPGGDGVFLVVAGELFGSVWCTVCGGVPQLSAAGDPIGFLSWFEDSLREAREWQSAEPRAAADRGPTSN